VPVREGAPCGGRGVRAKEREREKERVRKTAPEEREQL